MFILKLKHAIDTSKFDIIHVHEVLLAYFLKLLIRKKNIVYTCHTPIWCSPFYTESKLGRLYSLFLKILGAQEKKLIQLFPATIGLGNYLKKRVKNANIKIIPNGVDSHFQFSDKQKARKFIDMDSDVFLITTIARVVPLKGFDVLIDAIKKIDCTKNNLKVNIIGSLNGSFGNSKTISTYSEGLINQSKDLPINFLGFIGNRSKYFSHLLAASDIFILPSFFDSQPKVVFEAMACGVPVIVSDSGGMIDIITSDTGFVFRAGESKQLSEIIKWILENKKVLNKMRLKCPEHVRKNYNWKLIAQKNISFFKDLIYKS